MLALSRESATPCVALVECLYELCDKTKDLLGVADKKQCIYEAETLAATVAFHLWGPCIQGCKCVIFVDNEAAELADHGPLQQGRPVGLRRAGGRGGHQEHPGRRGPEAVQLRTTAAMNGSIASANNATLATVAANYGLKTVVDQHSLDIAARITPLEVDTKARRTPARWPPCSPRRADFHWR